VAAIAREVVAAVSTAAIVALALFPLRRLLLRWQMLDRPNARSSHVAPTPRGGGLAIVLATVLSSTIWIALVAPSSLRTVLNFDALAVIVAVLGWIDDRNSLPAVPRLFAQLALAAAAVSLFGPVNRLWIPMVGIVRLGVFGTPLTVLWIVGLTNAYNFMDGIDGIAGGQTAVAGLAWYVALLAVSPPVARAVALMTAAAAVGFLLHNWPPAKVFMGDVASGFLGFVFAVLPLLVSDDATRSRAPILALMTSAPFFIDTTFTLITRLRRGENVLQAHRDHVYQRLASRGGKHLDVTVAYVGLTALVGICAVTYTRASDLAAAAAICAGLGALLIAFVSALVLLR
jgi:UDP-N-acetylmuramyl pentapeptide phosphotransferase/UDP-N-acetylglucosamine-1-phosphate transferase